MSDNARTIPLVICILDGWGNAPAAADNAITAAQTPQMDRLYAEYPHGWIDASAKAVGLPDGQMGNSEVGHMHLGAGRVVLQDLPRIDDAIATGALAQNPTLQQAITALQQSGGTCHLMGLCSDGGVHAHIRHVAALAEIVAASGVPVVLHAFLDGRDTPPKSAKPHLQALVGLTKQHENITLGSMAGRYYAMDRDKRYERMAPAYAAMVQATGLRAQDPLLALEAAYARGESDEFVTPVVLGDYAGMQDGDGFIMANFRADRARQMLHALLDQNYPHFDRAVPVRFAAKLGMVEYSDDLAAMLPAMFPPEILHDTFGEVLATAGLRQLRIAETEKYAHVTFFFNGGREALFDGESRTLIPSPKVKTYDLQPEMSAHEVAEKVAQAVRNRAQDVVIVNFANPDMVGHTGNFAAAVKAIEAVDACVGQIAVAVEEAGGAMLVTADHGNAEAMHDAISGQAHTQHTLNLVPFIAMHPKLKGHAAALPQGTLIDVAPTALHLLGITPPKVMTGKNLLQGVL